MPRKPSDLVSLAEICRVTGYTARRIQQFAAEGAVPRAASGKYPLAGSVQGILRAVKSSRTVTSEARRILEAKARALELRNAEAEHRLIEMDMVQEAVVEIVGTFRSELNGLPAASTRDLDVRAEIEKQLSGAIDRCRARFEAATIELQNGRWPFADGDDD